MKLAYSFVFFFENISFSFGSDGNERRDEELHNINKMGVVYGKINNNNKKNVYIYSSVRNKC